MKFDPRLVRRSYELALQGYLEGGCPIGAVLAADDGTVLGEGYNRLVQEGNPILHGEMSALRAAGRLRSRKNTMLYTSLSPCMMCAGTIVQFKIPRVVVGDTVNSPGNVAFLRARGVEVEVVDDPDSIELVRKFRTEKPELWLEDWGGA
jgi:cytosine deaminase